MHYCTLDHTNVLLVLNLAGADPGFPRDYQPQMGGTHLFLKTA